MNRLDLKSTLIKDCSQIYLYVGRYKKSLPLSFRLKIKSTIQKDFKKGLKQINKKCPVYVELPKLKEEDYNSYSQEISNSREIVVTPTENFNPTIIDLENE